MLLLYSESQEDSGDDWRGPLLQQDQSRDGYVIRLNPGSPENVMWMQILGVAFIRVNASEEGLGWAEAKRPQAVGRGESSCQRPCEMSSLTQTPPGQPLPFQYSSLLHVSAVYGLYRVFWRFRPEALHNLYLSSYWGHEVTQSLTSPPESLSRLYYLLQDQRKHWFGKSPCRAVEKGL